MDTTTKTEEQKKAAPAPKKAGPSKLPSKSISFSNHPVAKGGKQAKASVDKSKKGGVNNMRKLAGM
jgi:hypothetical protein